MVIWKQGRTRVAVPEWAVTPNTGTVLEYKLEDLNKTEGNTNGEST